MLLQGTGMVLTLLAPGPLSILGASPSLSKPHSPLKKQRGWPTSCVCRALGSLEARASIPGRPHVAVQVWLGLTLREMAHPLRPAARAKSWPKCPTRGGEEGSEHTPHYLLTTFSFTSEHGLEEGDCRQHGDVCSPRPHINSAEFAQSLSLLCYIN